MLTQTCPEILFPVLPPTTSAAKPTRICGKGDFVCAGTLAVLAGLEIPRSDNILCVFVCCQRAARCIFMLCANLLVCTTHNPRLFASACTHSIVWLSRVESREYLFQHFSQHIGVCVCASHMYMVWSMAMRYNALHPGVVREVQHTSHRIARTCEWFAFTSCVFRHSSGGAGLHVWK